MPEPFRVLVIDDDPGVRDYLEALVSRQGYQVFAVPSGEEALRTLERTRPDLVTLDVVLPGMDGLETLRQLKKRLPDVPGGDALGPRPGAQHRRGDAARRQRTSCASRSRSRSSSSPSRRRSRSARCKQEVEELRGRARSETELLMLCGDDPR